MWLPVLLALAGCFWRPDPGVAPLALAEAPVVPLAQPWSEPEVQLRVVVRAGSAADPVGREGLAWLTANALVSGGTRTRGPAEVQAQLEGWGAELRAEVGPETVAFDLHVPPAHAVEAARLLGELLVSPGLDPVAVSHARARAQLALASLADAPPPALATQVLGVWLHESHPYGHLPLGRPEGLAVSAPLDVAQFHARRYVRSALAAGVAGPAGPELHQAQDALGAELSKAAPLLSAAPTPRLLPSREGRALLVVDHEGPAAGIALGQALDLRWDEPDGIALAAAAAALNARLLAEMGDLGLASASLEGPGERVQSALVVSLRPSSPERAAAALGRALRVIEVFAQDGVEPAELGAAPPALASLDSAVQAAAMGWPDPARALPERLADLSPARVNAAIARWIRPDAWSIVAVLPDPATLLGAPLEYPASSNVQTTAATSGASSAPDAPPATRTWADLGRVSVLNATELFR